MCLLGSASTTRKPGLTGAGGVASSAILPFLIPKLPTLHSSPGNPPPRPPVLLQAGKSSGAYPGLVGM